MEELLAALLGGDEVALHQVLGIDVFDPDCPDELKSLPRVATFDLHNDGRLVWAEACDDWFSAPLDRGQVTAVIEFLTAVRDQMPEPGGSLGSPN